MDLDDIQWVLDWAAVLHKVKAGTHADANVQLNREECTTLLKGLKMVNDEVKILRARNTLLLRQVGGIDDGGLHS